MTTLVVLSWALVFLFTRWLPPRPVGEIRITFQPVSWFAVDIVVRTAEVAPAGSVELDS
ncbi:hypothetical protein V5P93_000820 [Actinokineospora auranticolor]|uniref:Uncharacterized protein n=1 Tax=Actinokineospora auranticolor TaxID=155976 RepID=A0A2S6GYR8_9PSEU|nr:hypothetical protein [Actinokineospora auranticolor]PPK70301.1 hypothetical protein CLV40_102213 [Actinokineospora auranticolor]